jgi:hypothetical protein
VGGERKKTLISSKNYGILQITNRQEGFIVAEKIDRNISQYFISQQKLLLRKFGIY